MRDISEYPGYALKVLWRARWAREQSEARVEQMRSRLETEVWHARIGTVRPLAASDPAPADYFERPGRDHDFFFGRAA